MKLERINDNQIRCMLTSEDLAERELKLSELAYGTEKAKRLFKEMMTKASDELDFNAENIPLMIEAVPVSSECIMLIITKVVDPEELDTRFSKFTDFRDEDGEDADDNELENGLTFPDPGDVLDLFKQLTSEILAKQQTTDKQEAESEEIQAEASSEKTDEARPKICVYEFDSLSDVSFFSQQVPEEMNCSNMLYKHPVTKHFLLVLSTDNKNEDGYKEICALASEFGKSHKAHANTLFYFDEHYETVIRKNAIQVLRSL